ncbi:hypothetical protein T36_2155 [Helicobacter cinaedi]|uniref:hypothetical protein n=1 Tax=Helicobacter cinaedi TaxID=213 RepID=UPI001F32FF95|nr:hypothetical protein [Helicobacter cinaedi]BDB65676.1 hypothetical protein T36_2155 [Helicobacter cinaedi]
MNKFLVSLALVSSLSVSSLIAESSTLNKTDSELLFGTAQNANVEVLSENEMKETKGEFVDGLVVTATIIGGVAAGFEVYDRVKSWFD